MAPAVASGTAPRSRRGVAEPELEISAPGAAEKLAAEAAQEVIHLLPCQSLGRFGPAGQRHGERVDRVVV